ncbi:glutathione S-transferase family protein [Falsirhodobacter sp. alg1]|uniref:glutathione S-transferase family protein n=1 Tax=Falsirhodobacter sp. alg1 TaxID=1472418 RepID=UPI0005EFAF17|nr:glutathione S-transferase family protein [Falsirhodobacter sp. alg1]
MLTIYGVYRSRATRPLWLLGEIGMDFHHVPVIQSYRLDDPLQADAAFNTASEEFLTLNPMGQIPVMEDDGLILTESLGITQHIARKYGGPLGPQTPQEQALIEQWSLFAATGLEAAGLEILYTIRQGRQDTPEGQATIAAATEKLRRPLARLDKYTAAHQWLVGERFTVADLNVAECLRYAQSHSALIAQYPALDSWLKRCQARPAHGAMMAKVAQEPA